MLGFDDITNVKASDPGGEIVPQVSKSNGGYSLVLTFNTKSVGKGDKLPFTITFDTSTIAKKIGEIREINIPGITNPEDFSSFTVKINVPDSFGKPTYIKPDKTDNNLLFTKEQLGKSGISIAFGKEQKYSFSLKYHLRNDNIYPIRTEIALPPSTNYQEVFLTQISPQPLNVTIDDDGNWLAEYKLAPTEKKDIEVTGIAKISFVPVEESLSPDNFEKFLKEKQYWDVSRVDVQNLAQKLKTPRAIYDYVVNTLSYDFSRVTEDKPRLGGLNTLKNPTSAVCREFTDLFITVARAAGIPAREVNGFAYSENTKQRPLSLTTDILHSWPEYYDINKKTWIMVDPTWGNTTGGVDYFDVLDFDHFTFVIKGNDSSYPIPAGGYKFIDTKDKKDIKVSFTDAVPGKNTDITLVSYFPEVSIAGLPMPGKVVVKNTGTTKVSPQAFFIESKVLSPNQQVITTRGIPPFGSQTWDIKFEPVNFLTNSYLPFTIRFAPDSDIGDKTSEQKIKVAPFYLTHWGIGGITFGIFIIILFITALKIRRLRLPKR